jgi:ABC-type sugar transport system ATPase subunit
MASSDHPVTLSVAALGKSFPGVRALDGVSFTIPRGTVVGLVGENGAGKSTLIKILSGVYPDYDGEVELSGTPVSFASPLEAQLAGIATMFQELTLVAGLSVTENVFLGREIVAGPLGLVDRKAMRERTASIIAQLGVDIDPDGLVGDLSIANQQLVEICKALVLDSRLVIMDEPTSSLTQYEVEQLLGVIRALRETGRSILYVSHKLDEIFAICDQVAVMRDGRYVDGYPIGEASIGRIISDMVGRELTEVYPTPNGEIGEELLSVDSLTRRGEFTDVSLSVHAGEVLALAGLVGAGRTELAKAIIGSSAAEAGALRVAGKVGHFAHPQDAMAGGVVYLSEDRKGEGLLLDHSIGDNIVLSVLRKLSRLGIVDRKQRDDTISSGMRDLRVKASNGQVTVSSLSGGNQQKVVLARLLATDARVFILDEPTRGVDIGAKAEIYRIIVGLTAEHRGVILISSELPEVLGLAHRVALFRDGRLVRTLSRAEADPATIMNVLTGAAS